LIPKEALELGFGDKSKLHDTKKQRHIGNITPQNFGNKEM
jgi:hypothetical protein